MKKDNYHVSRSQTATFYPSQRWFAISKMDIGAVDMLAKLEAAG